MSKPVKCSPKVRERAGDVPLSPEARSNLSFVRWALLSVLNQ